jgi:hypothetical protein
MIMKKNIWAYKEMSFGVEESVTNPNAIVGIF